MNPLSLFRASKVERAGLLYARVALGTAFLSAVASRFGLYRNGNNFSEFIKYTAEVNSFMPSFTIPYIAVFATAVEPLLAIALIFGLWLRWTALAASALLFVFATAMAVSLGIKSPMDYSVYSASAAAFLLWLFQQKNTAKLDEPQETLRGETCAGQCGS
jgi:uncharacterized membrane protein YphA (DoxX/SURF4 family)